MQDLQVSVKKLTDEALMREACESTFLGKSKASLLDLYKAEHSPARTQLFWITLKNVKLFISTHLLRHHVGSIPFQLTCREDRKGGNVGMAKRCQGIVSKLEAVNENLAPDTIKLIAQDCIDDVEWLEKNADRNTKVNLSLLVNAQSLIDMAKLRLCTCAHPETRDAFSQIKQEIAKVDPSLASMMVRKCVYRGGICGELRCCGYNKILAFQSELATYLANFNKAQRGEVEYLVDAVDCWGLGELREAKDKKGSLEK